MKPLDVNATLPINIVVARKERDLRLHFLEQTEGDGAPRRITLEWPQLKIGRAPEADIRLSSDRASAQHAVLNRRQEDYVIRDEDSRNGVFLNGVKVHSAVLRDGDVVQVANSVFTYHEG
jgi:pSer/pThr/pTyr-binding forkhead associated (FHA) protein